MMKPLPTALLLASLLFVTGMNAQPKREMRASWIATVANIDWPSKAAQTDARLQQEEMTSILDSLQALRINTVIFQVRPTADALYPSALEPWSNWLTGKQGVAPEPLYDPLDFVVREAHRRCIDVHVWLNPYRVTNGFDLNSLADSHIYKQHPELFVKYGKQWYFDPGLDGTREWLNRVVADIVERYDIDAIHFDDYFYPYKIKGEDFPDDASFVAHPRGFTDKEDWRRNNVNMVIEELQRTIKSRKPWVEFGISPFGVWRNEADDLRGSKTQAGCRNYDDLYADILLWLEKGWIDYVTPQLYWEIGKKVADYEVLAHWWAENSYGKNLYIGQYVSALGNQKGAEAWRIPNELCRQIALNRTIPEIDGSIYFSNKGLLANKQGFCDSIRTCYYRYPALQPVNRNIVSEPALQPQNLRLEGNLLQWDDAGGKAGQQTAYYVVYAFPAGVEPSFDNPAYILARTQENSVELTTEYALVCVTGVNRYKQESMPCIYVNSTY